MSLAELLLPEFDAEIATTRRVLERVPDDRIEWRPHEKAFPMGHLAQLVARLPGWATFIMGGTEFDIAPAKPTQPGYSFEKVSTLLVTFDESARAGRAAIAAATDDDFQVQWTLKARGQAVSTMSRYMVVRMSLLNHLVHHRAQLGLYLRLTEQKVPQMYGPTADERIAPAEDSTPPAGAVER